MENSNTITFETKGGYKIVLNSFITGRQKRYINDSFLEDITLEGSTGDGATAPKFSMAGTKANVATDRAIESVVVSVDGPGVDKTKKIGDQVLDLPANDSDEVIAKINEVTGEKKTESTTEKI
jgi:hypothetical protein